MSQDKSKSHYFTPGIDPNRPLPDLGQSRIETSRFSSPEYTDREWTQLW